MPLPNPPEAQSETHFLTDSIFEFGNLFLFRKSFSGSGNLIYKNKGHGEHRDVHRGPQRKPAHPYAFPVTGISFIKIRTTEDTEVYTEIHRDNKRVSVDLCAFSVSSVVGIGVLPNEVR